MLKKQIALIFVLLVAFSGIASASVIYSETFSFNGGGTDTETPGEGSTTSTTVLSNYNAYISNLYADFSDFKRISKISVGGTYNNYFSNYVPGFSASASGINEMFTTFNSTVSGQYYGSGRIGWERTTPGGGNFNYVLYFDSVDNAYAQTLSGQLEIVLTYDQSVYTTYLTTSAHGSDYNLIGGTWNYAHVLIGAYSSVHGQARTAELLGTTQVQFSFDVNALETANNISSSAAYINLTKDNNNLRFIIENATGYSIFDQTTLTDVSILVNTGNGITTRLYHIDSATWANRTIIDASGNIYTTPTPTPTPTVNPSTGAGIIFDKSTYTLNQIGNISVIMQSSLIDLISSYHVDFYSDSNPLIAQYPVNGTTASFLVSFPATGAYTANLVRHVPLVGDSIIGTAHAQVNQVQSYIFAPTQANAGSNITISYQYGVTTTNGSIQDVRIDDFGMNIPGSDVYTTVCPCTANTLYNTSYIINGVGTHELRLWDTTNMKVVAKQKISILESGAVAGQNITTNYLAVDNTQYYINDVINGNYQISSSNFSSNSYFAVNLVGASNKLPMTMPVVLTQQTGTFQIPITQSQYYFITSGAAFVNLTAATSVINATPVTLASVPVTIVANNQGFSVSVNPFTICKTQPLFLKYTIGSSPAILQVSYSSPALTPVVTNYSITSNGTKQFIFDDGKLHDNSGILFDLYDSTGNFMVGTIAKYKSTGCTQPGTTPSPTVTNGFGAGSGAQQATQVASMLTSTIFWSLIITAGLMIAIAWRTKDGFPTGIIGILSAGAFTFLTWLPAWIFFSVLIIGALFVATSIISKQVNNVAGR